MKVKRGLVWLVTALAVLWLVPSLTVSAAELTAYPLTTYAERVKLLGGATLTEQGVLAASPTDGIAFYTVGGRTELVAQGGATFCVFVDAQYYGDVSVTDGERAVIADLPKGAHRVELFLDSGEATIRSIYADGDVTAVPNTPRVLVFDTSLYSVREMVETAHVVGMDIVSTTQEAADVVVVDDGEEAVLDERYPRARIVYVGEKALPFSYACEKTALASYLRQTAVPKGYFEELKTYVETAEEQLSSRAPAEPFGGQLRLETAIAKANDNVSGVLFSLYGELSEGPFSALLPKRADSKLFNTFILTGVLVAVFGVILLATAWVLILRKPKPTVCEEEEQKEESL